MSRIGKKPIQIPEGVEIKIDQLTNVNQKITVRGPKGELILNMPAEVKLEIKEKNILVHTQVQSKKTKAAWGLFRSLVFNMVEGVTKGFEKKLEIEGVGFGAQVAGTDLDLKVGYINTVKIKAPQGIIFSVEKNVITVAGISKELVGQVAAKIRKVKPVEPYKGKGIKYLGEIVRRKVGKRVAATTTGA
jgi:large subunit ribosomal protein L6